MKTVAEVQLDGTVGELLYNARASFKLERHEVSLRTKIPERYIQGLENGSYSEMPDDVYTKIYLKAYCAFLGLDAADMLGRYRNERTSAEKVDLNGRRSHPTTSIPASQLVVAPKIIRALLFGLVVLGIGMYFGLEVKKIITPPSVSLASPKDGLVTIERSVAIEGNTEREVALSINGKQVATDDKGNFKDILDLQEGMNVITIVAAKKYSKPMTVTRRIIVEPLQNPTASLPFGPGL